MTDSRQEALERLRSIVDPPANTTRTGGGGHPMVTVRLDDLRSLLATPAGQDAPDGWRPIETLPLAVRRVLIGNADGSCSIGWADRIPPDDWTHWMPLPPPPGGAR